MGGLINQTQRLQRIELQSSGGAALIRKYTLGYQSSSPFNVVSRLGSVQECSPTACMAATTFGWSDMQTSQGMQALGAPRGDMGVGSASYVANEPGYTNDVKSYTLDINGDGVTDALRIETLSNEWTQWSGYTLAIGTSTGQYPVTINGDAPGENGELGVYDLDDDGKEDFVLIGQWLHQKLDGTYWVEQQPPNLQPNVVPNVGGNHVDIDGDGFLDTVNVGSSTHLNVRFHKRDGNPGLEATSAVAWSAPSGTTISPVVDPQYHSIYDTNLRASQSVKNADINGDGRQDLLLQVNNGWRVLYSNGTGFTTGELIVSTSALVYGSVMKYFPPVPIDMNGDGCTDLAYVKTSGGQRYWYLAKSTCGAVGASLTLDIPTNIIVTGLAPTTMAPEDWGSVAPSDFNHDGNMDLMVGPVALLSTGTTLISHTTMSGFAAGQLQFWADRNGDGVLDYVSCTANWYTCEYRPGVGVAANRLVSATDGFGKSATFSYSQLTDSSVYTRGTTGIGRTQDVQSSMSVVKSITLSDGVGATYKQSYTYAGAKRNVSGRGFLGVASREVTDSRTGFVTREVYNNTVATNHSGWEFTGNLEAKTVYQYRNGASYGPKVEELSQAWSSIQPTGNSTGRYPFVVTSVAKRYELTGANSPISTSTIAVAGTNGASGIDEYGTIYDVSTTTVEGTTGLSSGSASTVRRYTPPADILNDTANWCIGKQQRLEDIRSHTYNATDGAQLTRVSTQAWVAAKCRITHSTVAPGTGWQLDTAIEYDDFNNVNKTTVTGSGIPAGNPIVTEANFGGNGHLQQTATNAKGHVTTFGWNINLGFRTSAIDPNSQTTTWIPDDFGREKEMIRPDGTRTYKSYYNCTSANSFCGNGLLRYVVRTEERNAANDPNNLVNYSDQFVDVMGRVKYVQSRGFGGQTVVSETLYDNRGNVALKTNPYYAGTGSVSGTAMYYDNLNRLVRTQRTISDSDRTVVSEHVVYEGMKIRSFDANGIETSKTTNVLGVAAQAVDHAGKITGYTYNAFGELLKATDPANNQTKIRYNVRGFKSDTDDPDMGYWSYTYDALGQMLTQIDAKSQTTAFTYDELGRPKSRIDHPGGAGNTTTWTWDGPGGVATLYYKGQLYSVTSPGGYSETYAYDTRARRSQVSTIAASTTFVMDYSYDPSLGALSTVAYPSSTGARLSVLYGYQNGFARDVRDVATGGLIWQANSQDARGHVTQEQYGNGQITNLGFDQTNGRLYTIQTGTGSATQNLTYAWDRVGNLASRRDNNQGISEAFGYDAVYRLTSVHRNGTATATMVYDTAGIGNVASKSDVGAYDYSTAQAGCTYYSHSQPHAVRKVGTNIYCYDANGNMVSRSGATVSISTFNFPLTITQAGGNSSTFSYGAERNRYRTIAVDGGVSEDKLEIGGGAFERVTSGTSIQYRHHVLVNDKAVAIVTRNATTAAPTTLTSAKSLYLHHDHLGSLDAISDESNAIVLRTTFDAWGKRRGSNWTGTPSAADKAAIAAATRKGYTGHQQLDNLDLVHMNGRVYDPVIARFLSADPIVQDPYHSQAFNRYSYVWNNPLNATDPTGFKCEKLTGSNICWPDDEVVNSAFVPDGLQPSGVEQNGQGKWVPTPTGQPAASQTGGNDSAQDLSSTDADAAMATLNPKQLAMNSCKAATANSSGGGCSIDSKKIDELLKKGPYYGGTDATNPNYVGKVVTAADGTVKISLTVEYTGDVQVATKAAQGIVQEYAAAGVTVSFGSLGSSGVPDLVIHGAKLEDFVTAGVACDCKVALSIGGWGPFASTQKTGFANKLLINGWAGGSLSRNAAHEFGHKLGLTHKPGGIMDYPNQNQGPVNPSDVQRIRGLYGP